MTEEDLDKLRFGISPGDMEIEEVKIKDLSGDDSDAHKELATYFVSRLRKLTADHNIVIKGSGYFNSFTLEGPDWSARVRYNPETLRYEEY